VVFSQVCESRQGPSSMSFWFIARREGWFSIAGTLVVPYLVAFLQSVRWLDHGHTTAGLVIYPTDPKSALVRVLHMPTGLQSQQSSMGSIPSLQSTDLVWGYKCLSLAGYEDLSLLDCMSMYHHACGLLSVGRFDGEEACLDVYLTVSAQGAYTAVREAGCTAHADWNQVFQSTVCPLGPQSTPQSGILQVDVWPVADRSGRSISH
jgi:hypothetical protein